MRWIALLGLVAAACAEPTDPIPPGKQLSIIDPGTPAAIEVADTVAAGLVTIRYHSYGSSSCNRPNGDDVTETGSTITITAYDHWVSPTMACTADFGTYNRESIVSLSAGTKLIRVRGTKTNGTEAVLSKTIVVR